MKFSLYSPWIIIFFALGLAGCMNQPASVSPTARDTAIPLYDHIFVIIAENHDYGQIIDNPNAPNLTEFAHHYGLATQYYGIVHPSEGNYVALLGGSTFGIHDDDAYYCKPALSDPNCPSVAQPNYPDHSVSAKSLVDQLSEKNLSWKGYFETLPAPGSKAVYYPTAAVQVAGQPNQLYASKHNGFINYANVQNRKDLGQHFVGFGDFAIDLAGGTLPNFAEIVPNQCNEMHGLNGANVPPDCDFNNDPGRIRRGDKAISDLVKQIQSAPIWLGPKNVAIIVTFDEDSNPKDKSGIQGCCGFDPASADNFGGGHIATIVVTNHGPKSVSDDTPYNHYSLLRTIEDAFRIPEHLGRAAASDQGVQAMTPLFEVK